ncbi:MAG TPA: TIGR03435 family protein [Bryobacteraceae bacterium]|nr:TIGR03435 family protein [Bryobacteraceae bacterium]
MFRLISTTVLAMAASTAWGQTAVPLSFEVASVKPAAPCCAPNQWRGNQIGADRIDFQYSTLKYCITFAYGVKSYQVSGPNWLNEARFDIVAKGPDGTRREQLPAMMQALLAERFKLQVHREMKEVSGLTLIVGRNGPKLKESEIGAGDGRGGASIGMSSTSEGTMRMTAKGATMGSLVNTLTSVLGQPVIDKTGLTGRYDMALEYSREDAAGFRVASPPPGPSSFGPAPEPAVSIYGSIQQLGLKLEAGKFPLDTIVIDHVEKMPTEN